MFLEGSKLNLKRQKCIFAIFTFDNSVLQFAVENLSMMYYFSRAQCRRHDFRSEGGNFFFFLML